MIWVCVNVILRCKYEAFATTVQQQQHYRSASMALAIAWWWWGSNVRRCQEKLTCATIFKVADLLRNCKTGCIIDSLISYQRGKLGGALTKVSEWIYAKGLFKFTSTEHAVQLDLIGRVHGFLSAENYFNSLQDADKNNKTYGALLNCYVRQRQVDKALAHFEKMKEMGFASTTLTYNDIMCLYSNIGKYDKVPDVLAEMKKNKLLPDNYSYRLCINSYGGRSDIEAVENCLKEAETQPHMAVDWNTYAVAANFYIKENLFDKAVYALKKAEVRLDDKDNVGYSFLISLYAKLGKKDEILKLWELEKNIGRKCINRDFITLLESLVKVGALEEAETVLKEWESSNNVYDYRVPNVVILGYLNRGLAEKGEVMLNELLEKGRPCHPNSWSILAGFYQAKGEMHKAMSCMRVALSFYVPKGWRPYNQIINDLLSWVGDYGSLEEAESFVGLLRNVNPVNRPMYHALMKAYIRNGKNVDGLLEKMKADKLSEDEKTKMILSSIP
ncbi:pentatricopeptide repeat-containing protein At4g21705, mitochondrial-like isoform X2 [Silene latifolia]|uniref:pentatricopeptide repeat-containing protein At4g21705, mitochondrial-like isoform X2 n=1 Tax=Silene latifolia TaxID=37657 RepID=UPI003D7806CC